MILEEHVVDLAGFAHANTESVGGRSVIASGCEAILRKRQLRSEASLSGSADRGCRTWKGTREGAVGAGLSGREASQARSGASRCNFGRAFSTVRALSTGVAERNNNVAKPATAWPDAKKKTLHACERTRPDVVVARERFAHRRRRWQRSRLWFVDESGVNHSLTRSEAWAPRGERIVDSVPGRRWETFTVIAALSVGGLHAPMLLPGAMNTEALRVWVRDCLAPLLRPADIVIWDNLGIHEDPEVAALIRALGARLEFFPVFP